MSIRNYCRSVFGLATLATFSFALFACSDDSSSSTEEQEFGYVPSSSSISTRADIDYKDSIVLNKKLDLNFELIKKNSDSQDSSEIYIDSSATSVPLYLGELTSGSRIRVKASTSNIENDKIRIRSEHGEYLRALTAVAKNENRRDSAFGNFMVPSLGTITDSTYLDSNQFVVFAPNHYYLEVDGYFTDQSTARLLVQIDTAYYNYIGEDDSVSMEMNDTLRGIVLMGDDSPETVFINFKASEGYSLNLTVDGANINKYELLENDSLLGKTTSALDTMLIPNDSVNWTLKVSPETFSYYSSGPFAFFNTITRARSLGKGEYFANPDSIEYLGEALKSVRPKDLPEENIYRYNLRQEQFVWLGDYKKGDTLQIKHWIENYKDDFKSSVTLEVMDKNKKVLGSIRATSGGGIKIPSDGPYYLHYLRLNSEPMDQVLDSLRYVLQLYTLVQQPGLFKSMTFRDASSNDPIDSAIVYTGEILDLNNFSYTFVAKGETKWKEFGNDVNWYVPCESLNYITREIYDAEKCAANGDEQLISSDYLIVEKNAAMQKATLIAESKADPEMRASLKLIIRKSAD